MNAPGRSVVSWLKLLVKATLTSLGILKIRSKTLVLEFGTDHPGDLAYLASIVRPDIVVLTSIAPEHTEFFRDNRRGGKRRAFHFEFLTKDGIAILNADDERVMKGKDMTDATVVTFGESQEARVRLVSAEVVIDENDPSATGLEVQILQLALRRKRGFVEYSENRTRSRQPRLSLSCTRWT